MGHMTSANSKAGSIYATFWRMVYMGVHRYGSTSTGALLTVLTITLLDKAGYNPTIPELVDITGLKKSNVARYVSRQIQAGLITEFIDPQNRRRRQLCPTDEGRKVEEWHRRQTLEMSRVSGKALRGLGKKKGPSSDLMQILLGVGQEA